MKCCSTTTRERFSWLCFLIRSPTIRSSEKEGQGLQGPRCTLTSQRAMNLCGVVLCIVCIHHVRGSEEHITGYSGQSVVLKSGADRSRTLIRIQWSIYKNTTYIAGLKDGEVIKYIFWRHLGRLHLNITTGDLTIFNLTKDDSMIYSADLVFSDGTRKQDKVHLTVQESLKKPDVQSQAFHSLNHDQCYIVLNCTGSDPNANLSWTHDSEFSESYISGTPNVGSSLVLFVSCNFNRNVTVNCTASRGQQTETRQITVGCLEEKQKCEVRAVCSACSSCTSSVILSIVFTSAAVLLVCACAKNKDKIKDACPESLRHFPSIRTSFSPHPRGVQGKQGTA